MAENQEATSHTIKCGHGKNNERTVTLSVGQTCRVEPFNPLATKHRGRVCTLLEFESDFMPASAMVLFEDDNRKGKVAVDDLLPITDVG